MAGRRCPYFVHAKLPGRCLPGEGSTYAGWVKNNPLLPGYITMLAPVNGGQDVYDVALVGPGPREVVFGKKDNNTRSRLGTDSGTRNDPAGAGGDC